uniref:Axin 2 (conductin, axil) n=1 Tax=Sander lucioperca TaxID=283035 RepID=A0A8C9YL97_SANLU
MSTMSRALMDHIASSFREDAPRPPVPGEEGEAPCYPGKLAMMKPLEPPKSVLLGSPGSSARRNEDGLGEPEGSASPDSPLSRWTKSLHSLLGDQDGALLFRTFLEREKCVDTLDFWFACNGFRQMDLKDTKTQRVMNRSCSDLTFYDYLLWATWIDNLCVMIGAEGTFLQWDACCLK